MGGGVDRDRILRERPWNDRTEGRAMEIESLTARWVAGRTLQVAGLVFALLFSGTTWGDEGGRDEGGRSEGAPTVVAGGIRDSEPGARPRLILQITVDALRGDLPARFAQRYGEGGFRRLFECSTHYANAHLLHQVLGTSARPVQGQPKSKLQP